MEAKENISNQSNSTLYGGDTVPCWEIPVENSSKPDKNPSTDLWCLQVLAEKCLTPRER